MTQFPLCFTWFSLKAVLDISFDVYAEQPSWTASSCRHSSASRLPTGSLISLICLSTNPCLLVDVRSPSPLWLTAGDEWMKRSASHPVSMRQWLGPMFTSWWWERACRSLQAKQINLPPMWVVTGPIDIFKSWRYDSMSHCPFLTIYCPWLK